MRDGLADTMGGVEMGGRHGMGGGIARSVVFQMDGPGVRGFG